MARTCSIGGDPLDWCINCYPNAEKRAIFERRKYGVAHPPYEYALAGEHVCTGCSAQLTGTDNGNT